MTHFSALTPPVVKNGTQMQTLSALGGVCQAVTLASLVRQHPGTTLLVTSDTPSALSLELELTYLLGKCDIKVRLFPDRETLPYDSFSPHQDLISQRLETLSQISQTEHSVVIVPVTTLMMRLPPKAYLSANVFVLKKGDRYQLHNVRQHLTDTGYHLVEQVYEHGEFAIRGSILDIFPTGVNMPLRIELFDDEVETIRHFDPETQRSLHPVESIRLLPAKEFPTDSAAIEGFRQRYRRRFEVIVKEPESVYQLVSRNLMPAGIENYLPLFFDEVATLFDYLPKETQLVTLGDIEKSARAHLQEVETRYQDRRVDPLRPLLAPKELYLLIEELFAAFKPLPRYQFISPTTESVETGKTTVIDANQLPDISANHKLKQPLLALQDYAQNAPRMLFSAESEGRREALLELLSKIQLKPALFSHFDEFIQSDAKLGLIVSPLSRGCLLKLSPKDAVSIICETELLVTVSPSSGAGKNSARSAMMP